MIRASITVKEDDSVRQILELLKGRRSMATIARFLLKGVEDGSQQILGKITKQRLTGDGPFPVPQKRLGNVSRRLRQSMRFTRPTFSGGKLKTAVGSNVKYFGRHEFGGGGRQIRVKAAKVKAYTVNNAFGRGKRVKVPAHTRQAYLMKDNMPKREPVQAGLREHATREYGIAIEKQLIKAMEGRML